VRFEVAVGETDLLVLAEKKLRDEARRAARQARRAIESHAVMHPEFLTSRSPLAIPDDARGLVASMYEAARAAGTGPMAAVAGAVAEYVARELAHSSAEVIVENGGDLYIISGRERVIGIDAGRSPWTGKLAVAVPAGEMAMCTSSGTVGHSASGGRADAVIVAADDGALADALATAGGNRVSGPEDAQSAVEWLSGHQGVRHAIVISGEAMAAWGELELRQPGRA